VGNHLNITTSDDVEYHERELKESKKAAKARGLDYLVDGVESDDTPLSVGLAATPELLRGTITDHCHPGTGEYLLEQAPSNFAGPGVLLAREAAKRGVDLPDELQPATLETKIAGARFKKQKRQMEREAVAAIKGLVVKEQFDAMRKAAKKAERKNVAYFDLTNSLDKTIALFYVGAQAANDRKTVADLEVFRWEIGKYQVDLVEKLIGSRMGANGIRHVDGGGTISIGCPHNSTREGDPDFHLHIALANFTRCEDGKYRKLDSAALLRRHKSLIAALTTRYAVERFAERFGVEMRYDEKSKDWVIAAVDREDVDVFSTASRSIKRRAEAWRKEFKRLTGGREPSAKDMDAATDRLNIRYRKRKGEVDLGPDAIKAHSDKLLAKRGKALTAIHAAVTAARTVLKRPEFDQDAVISEAIVDIGRTKRTAFKAGELAMAIHRRMPVFNQGPEYGTQMLMETLAQAIDLSPELACLAAPDPVGDMPDELRRKSDNGSVYMPSGNEFYAHVDTLTQEQRLMTLAYDKSAPAISAEKAAELVEGSGLHPSQAHGALTLLTSRRTVEPLVGPAGTGKTHLIAKVAAWWQSEVGLPAMGLALSQPAANEMTKAGIKRSFNTDRAKHAWMRLADGNPKPGDENYRITQGTLVFLDEASMMSTKAMFEITDLVHRLGGKVVPTGDHKQLAAIELGGGFQMLAEDRGLQRDGGVLELVEVTRFEDPEQGIATLGLREGDPEALGYYDEKGWILGGTTEEMATAAAEHYVTRLLQKRDVRVIVYTEDQKQDLDVRIRQMLVEMGLVDNEVTATLSDRTLAGRGDLIQVRQNDRLVKDPTGHELTNRDLFRVEKVLDDGALKVRRRLGPAEYAPAFVISGDYLAEHGTGGYASTGHAVEGQTVEFAYPVADERATREWFYVAMSRAIYENKAFLNIGSVDEPHLSEPDEPDRNALDVAQAIMARSGAELSATHRIAQTFEETWGLQRTGAIWADITAQLRQSENHDLLAASAGERIAALVANDEAAPAFWMAVSEARERGYDVNTLVPEIVRQRELHSAESMAKVLQSRIQVHMEEHPAEVANVEPWETFVQRTPKGQGELYDAAMRVAEHNDRRAMYLGQRAADDPTEVWMNGLSAEQLAPVMAYREQYGAPSAADSLTDPIGRAPSKLHQPERYHAWKSADDALGNPDRGRDASRLTDAELRDRIIEWRAVKAVKPEDVKDALEAARAALGRAELRHEEAIEVMGKKSRYASMMGEALDEVKDQVERLEVEDQKRRQWWRGAEAVCTRQEEAVVELQRRHSDEPIEAAPKVSEQMTPEELIERNRQREIERRVLDRGIGLSLGP
jgi:conjugative relaxase-like TrwC/TraI family protein